MQLILGGERKVLAHLNAKPKRVSDFGREHPKNHLPTCETHRSPFRCDSFLEQAFFQNLADVYAVITYYLRNKDSVEKYLNNRMQLAEQIKRRNQENKNINDIRKRLLARQNQ